MLLRRERSRGPSILGRQRHLRPDPNDRLPRRRILGAPGLPVASVPPFSCETVILTPRSTGIGAPIRRRHYPSFPFAFWFTVPPESVRISRRLDSGRQAPGRIPHMPGFKIHISASTTIGIAYGGGAFLLYHQPLETCLLATGLCSVSGMLPDLDSGPGRPLRESVTFAAAVVPC